MSEPISIPDAWSTKRPGVCLIPKCDRPVLARGLCKKHYHRWWRRGGAMGGREPRFGLAGYSAKEAEAWALAAILAEAPNGDASVN